MIIRTKFLSPSNSRGPRVKATAMSGKSCTIGWNHRLSVTPNHLAAAEALFAKLSAEYGIANNEPMRFILAVDRDGEHLWVQETGAQAFNF